MSAPNSAVPSVAEAPRFDFPSWLPPMLVKELRQGLRQRGFVGGMIAAQAVLAIMFVWAFAIEVDQSTSWSLINGVFWGTVFVALLLVAPLRALGALHTEIDSRTMDLLLLTRLDSWRIVWSKWISLVTQSLLLTVSVLPYALVRYFFGSVEVVTDMYLIVVLVVFSAILTAAALCASGANRVLRFLLILGLTITFLGGLGGFLGGVMMGGGVFGMAPNPGSLTGWVLAAVWGWVAACAIGFWLMLAVRWFAPMAENHAIGPRLLPVALALPLPIVAWLGTGNDLAEYLVFWGLACGFIALIELADTRKVMAIHLRGGLSGPVWRLAGALLLPGWPSAALWSAMVLVVAVLVALVANLFLGRSSDAGIVILAVPLVWAGLVAPALLVAGLRSVVRVTSVLYFIIHGLCAALVGLAVSDAFAEKVPGVSRAVEFLAQAVPPMSFWHACRDWDAFVLEQSGWLVSFMGVAVTAALVWRMGRTYWANVQRMRGAPLPSATRTETAP